MAEKILIIDDDVDTLRLVGLMLQRQGYQITAASNGEQGLAKAFDERPDLILLDVMMPDMDGYEVARRLRKNPATVSIPILMFTAKTQLDDKVAGFEVGADDYLIKPFAFAELVARLRVMLRRNIPDRELVLRADNLELDLVAHRVVRNGVVLDLSQREFELLEFLLRHRNTTVTRDMISREVWKEPDGVWTNVIEVYINSLRKKVEQPDQRQLIQTVRGVGYALRDA